MSRFQSHIVCHTLFAGVVLLLSAATVFGEVKGVEDIIFTGCPPYVESNHCDSIFYQVVAVDYETGEKHPPGVEYFLVEGPGTINEETGLWIFHPELEEHWQSRYWLEIGATVNGDSTSGEDNCRFEVRLTDRYAEFEVMCDAHFSVLPFDSAMVPARSTDPDHCDEAEVEFVTIPEPNGLVDYDPATGILKFIPTYDDLGQTFRVDLHAKSSPYWMGCSFYFDVFVSEPIKVDLTTVRDATPGDTVSIDVVLEECVAGIGEIDLLLTYDDQRLDLVAIDSGAEFFSPDTGCGWAAFIGRGTVWDGVPVVRMAGRARRHSDPVCFTPPEQPAVFARLQFMVTDSSMTSEVLAPVRFYWMHCNSNMISWGVDPDSIYYPAAVYDHNGQFIHPDTVPGFSGATQECFPSTGKYMDRFRQVEYYNGGVQILPPPPPPVMSPYVVRIGTEHMQLQNHFSDVDITLEGVDSLQGLGGYDMLVAYDQTALAFQVAFEGSIYTECGWEYFTFRQGPFGNCGEGCPSGMVRIIGVAEQNDGPHHPTCDVDTLPTTLASMRFLVSDDHNLECQFVPIRFYWIDCGDNALTNAEGTDLYVSSSVYDFDLEFNPEPINDGTVGFPTFQGAQDFCTESPNPYLHVQRRVDFINGGVDIICPEPFDHRGDINLNYIRYEIADAVLYTDYFREGWSAFGDLDSASVIAASDVNNDGNTLHISDLISLLTVVTGTTVPADLPDTAAHMSVTFAHDTTSKTVRINVPDDVDSIAVHLRFRGDIGEPSTSAGYIANEGYHCGLWRLTLGNLPGGTTMFSYTGEGVLEEAQAAYGCYYVRTFIGGVPCGPGDLDGDGNMTMSDLTVMIAYLFNGTPIGSEDSACVMSGSDVNGDGRPMRVEDWVVLLNRLFRCLDIDPDTTMSPHTAIYSQDDDARMIYLSTPDSLGMVLLVFDGDIAPVSVQDSVLLDWYYDGVRTRVRVLPTGTPGCVDTLFGSNYFLDGPLISYTGEGDLIEVQSTTYLARPVNSVIDNVMGVDDNSGDDLPNTFALTQNYPNPFNPETRISYALPVGASVEIVVYNIAGQKVRTLVNGHRPAGYHETVWDGRNASGNMVSSGIYFYRIIAGEFTQSRKMMLLK